MREAAVEICQVPSTGILVVFLSLGCNTASVRRVFYTAYLRISDMSAVPSASGAPPARAKRVKLTLA